VLKRSKAGTTDYFIDPQAPWPEGDGIYFVDPVEPADAEPQGTGNASGPEAGA